MLHLQTLSLRGGVLALCTGLTPVGADVETGARMEVHRILQGIEPRAVEQSQTLRTYGDLEGKKDTASAQILSVYCRSPPHT